MFEGGYLMFDGKYSCCSKMVFNGKDLFLLILDFDGGTSCLMVKAGV